MVKISLFFCATTCALIRKSLLIEAGGAGSTNNDSNAAVGDNRDNVISVPPAIRAIRAPVGDDERVSGDISNNLRLSSFNDTGDGNDTTIGPTDANLSSALGLKRASDDSNASDADFTTDLASVTWASADNDGSMSTDSSYYILDASADADTPVSHDTTLSPVMNDGSVSGVSDIGDRTASDDTPDLKVPASTLSVPGTGPYVKDGPKPIVGQVKLVPGFGDCGGFNFNYTIFMPTYTSTTAYTMLTCEQGYRCQEVEGSYTYRCNEWPSRAPVSFYGQCGGGNYDGQTFCAPGAVCKYISGSFSQCLPTY